MAMWMTVIVFGLVLNPVHGQNVEEARRKSELRDLLTRFLEDEIKREEVQVSTPNDFVINSMMESASTGQISGQGQKSGSTTLNSLSTECVTHARYRRIDGRCNNPANPETGSTNQPFKRLLPPVYEDGVNTPRMRDTSGNPLPSPRSISTTAHFSKARPASDSTVMVMQWGQFIDHDLTGTPTHITDSNTSCCDGFKSGENHPDVSNGGPCFPIEIPSKDTHFTKECMAFRRSAAASGRVVREQINLLTSFLDASMVYGLSEEQSQGLRNGPYLRTKGQNLLPETEEEICHLENKTHWCFAAGDDRVNVFPGLSVLHTIFMREHNRLVRELSDIMPRDTPDDVLFEEARKIVSAILQHITYNEWLPVVVGPEAMNKFKLTPGSSYKYDPNSDPTIANVFATAAFRYGHSAIPRFLRLRGKKIFLRDLFNRPTEVIKDLDAVLESILEDRRQTVDRFVTDMMTDHLFETEAQNSFDIVSLNIQRGRDHGLPPYNKFRDYCNLKPMKSFNSPGMKVFSRIYSDPDDIDVFSGAISETPVKDGAVGPLLACLIGQQFADIKYGDSHWYETADSVKGFTKEQLSEIKRISLAKVLCDNSGLGEIQRNPFKIYSHDGNPKVPCCDLPTIDLKQWSV